MSKVLIYCRHEVPETTRVERTWAEILTFKRPREVPFILKHPHGFVINPHSLKILTNSMDRQGFKYEIVGDL